MTNVNCLQGIACANCGNNSVIHIDVRVLAKVTDDGTETFGDMEWDGDSFTECPQCEHRGTLAEFRIRNANHDSTTEE